MVTQLQMNGMIIQIAIAFLVPLAILIFLLRKKLIRWKSLGLGVVVFMLYSQIIEKGIHLSVLDPSGDSLKWTDSTVAFVAYGALAAGVCEEVGRYIGFRFMNNKRWEYKDGLSLGLGHGTIEAILVSVFAGINSLMFAHFMNSGMLEQAVGTKIPVEQMNFIKEQLINTGFTQYVLGGFERIPALFIHIALSLIVLLAVRERRFLYVIYAIGLHALVDVVPALYQKGAIQNLWIIESIIALIGVTALVFIIKAKKRFGVQLNV